MNLHGPMDVHACRALALELDTTQPERTYFKRKPRLQVVEGENDHLHKQVADLRTELQESKLEVAHLETMAADLQEKLRGSRDLTRKLQEELKTAMARQTSAVMAPVPAGPGYYDDMSRSFTVSDMFIREILDGLAPYTSNYMRDMVREKVGRMWDGAGKSYARQAAAQTYGESPAVARHFATVRPVGTPGTIRGMQADYVIADDLGFTLAKEQQEVASKALSKRMDKALHDMIAYGRAVIGPAETTTAAPRPVKVWEGDAARVSPRSLQEDEIFRRKELGYEWHDKCGAWVKPY